MKQFLMVIACLTMSASYALAQQTAIPAKSIAKLKHLPTVKGPMTSLPKYWRLSFQDARKSWVALNGKNTNFQKDKGNRFLEKMLFKGQFAIQTYHRAGNAKIPLYLKTTNRIMVPWNGDNKIMNKGTTVAQWVLDPREASLFSVYMHSKDTYFFSSQEGFLTAGKDHNLKAKDQGIGDRFVTATPTQENGRVKRSSRMADFKLYVRNNNFALRATNKDMALRDVRNSVHVPALVGDIALTVATVGTSAAVKEAAKQVAKATTRAAARQAANQVARRFAQQLAKEAIKNMSEETINMMVAEYAGTSMMAALDAKSAADKEELIMTLAMAGADIGGQEAAKNAGSNSGCQTRKECVAEFWSNPDPEVFLDAYKTAMAEALMAPGWAELAVGSIVGAIKVADKDRFYLQTGVPLKGEKAVSAHFMKHDRALKHGNIAPITFWFAPGKKT